jgi:hypothetical protein
MDIFLGVASDIVLAVGADTKLHVLVLSQFHAKLEELVFLNLSLA